MHFFPFSVWRFINFKLVKWRDFRLSVVLKHKTGTKLVIPTPISAFAKFFLHAAAAQQKQTLIIGRWGSWRPYTGRLFPQKTKTLLLQVYSLSGNTGNCILLLHGQNILPSNNDFRCSLCSDASFVFHWYFINFMGCSIVHFLLMTYFWYIYFLFCSEMFTFSVK